MDINMIAPVRGLKKKRDKKRIASAILIISFVVITSAYLTYWYFYQYPGILEQNAQDAIRLNESLINQGRMGAINSILNSSLNCVPTIISFSNNSTGQNNSVTLLPFNCFSEDLQNYIIENELQ